MDRNIYISNNVLSLVEYRPCDDRALYEDWLDSETQKGYNCIYVTTFEDFQSKEVKQRFFAMIRLNGTNEIIGAVGISPPETEPDLAIRIFKPYRRQGYGTSAFALATKYAVDVLKIEELHAGAYPDNTGSLKMLKKCGYIPYPLGNISEKHYITGEDIIQLDHVYKPVAIRLAVPADAPDMAEVMIRSWEAAYKDIIPAEYIREKNATRLDMFKRTLPENIYTYVIQYDGKTVGIIRVAPPDYGDMDDAYYDLHSLYLHPHYFGQGIGTRAMEFAFNKALSLGKTVLVLWVLADNVNAIKFYKKLGFTANGERREFNYGKLLTAIRMRRNL